MTTLRILSVNVGLPRLIGEWHGEPVVSGIVKNPVETTSVQVGNTHIEGDGQADLTVHGGIDKAVYCYPTDHWPWWETQHAFPCRPAVFGENLTVAGADETQVAIGDRFRWGDVILEISQPRAPCYKFALVSQRPDAPALMTMSGRCGWYFRVVQAGVVSTRNASLAFEEKSGGPDVREAFFAALDPKAPKDALGRVASAPALATSWREAVSRRL